MAFAEQNTKLSLDRWFRLIGVNPLHANSVVGPKQPTVCAAIWYQKEWMSADRVSREEVARAIAQAEANIEQMIGYRLLPTFERDEWHPTARAPKPEWLRIGSQDVRGFAQAVEAKWGYVLAGGIEGKTLIGTEPITWSDEDGDTYKETGTVTVTTDVAQCEIRAFYPHESGNATYEIRPINVTVSSGVATITFRREQCVLKELLLREYPEADDDFQRPIDGMIDANFLEEIDVYRVYVDRSTQAQLMWEPLDGCGCGTGSCPNCLLSSQSGCLSVHADPRLGWLSYRPATWNATDEAYDIAYQALSRQPDMVRLWYYAGWADQSRTCPTTQMDANWERTVAYYAAALLDRPVCECNNVHAWIEHWRRDLAIPGADEGLRISSDDLNCPFGTRRGAINAYKRCLAEGVRIGEVAVP